MASIFYSTSNFVKKAFSSAEYHLLQLQEAGLAVLKVLKPNLKREIVLSHVRRNEVQENGSETTEMQGDAENRNYDGNKAIEAEESSLLKKVVGFLCSPIFPCVKSVLPTEYAPHSASNKLCGSVGCNCCFCLPHSGSGNCLCKLPQSHYLYNAIILLCPFLLVGFLFWNYYDSYVSKLLKSFEEMDDELALAIFVASFIVASLPLVWGYVLLNLAAGYRYGIFQGVIVVMISVTIGLTLTHKASKRFCAACIFNIIKRQAYSDHIDAILKVLDSPAGLKVIALTRLTPIPFGLQNGIFAMSDIRTMHYVAASNIGLFPTQVLNCYIGSTFHSAEDVFNRGGSFGGYLVFIIQVSIGITLLTFVIHHARRELAAALHSPQNLETRKESQACEQDSEKRKEVRIKQPSYGSAIQAV